MDVGRAALALAIVRRIAPGLADAGAEVARAALRSVLPFACEGLGRGTVSPALPG